MLQVLIAVIILDRYFMRELFKFFGIILVAVITIFLIVDFFEKIDDFIEAGVPLQRAGLFFLLRIPFVIGQLLPIAVFLAALITLGLMNKRNELLALRGGGIGMIFFLRSLLLVGFLSSVALFVVSDILVPISFSRADRMYTREVDKKEALTSRQKNFWIKGNRSISHIKFYDASTRTMSGITLYFFNEKFNLVRQVDATSATFENDQWVFRDILDQVLSTETGEYKTSFHEQRIIPLEIGPENLERVAKKSEEMNVLELLEYSRTVEKEGYDATRFRVDFHAKIAFPFVCIVLCLLALGIGVKPKFKDQIFVVIVVGVGVAFAYWALNSFCLSLGYGGVLPPIAAAWTANSVFVCVGVVSLLNLE